MGALWVAFDRRLRRKIAIKFIHPMAAELEEAHSRFEREARAAAQLRSPHVVQTYDYGIDRGHSYIVMELLEGEDLGARLGRERRLPLLMVSKILGQIAKGLDTVHAAGIIHRDLKPANIFVSVVGGEETVKLIDFGVARAEEKDGRRTTARGALLGTVKYMAPEQALGETTIDHRADLWSLAVIVYRLLTGIHPFHGATMDELVLSICQDRIAPPSSHVPGLPPGIDTFFERAFSRDPESRFHSAQQMSSAFLASFATTRNGTLPWGLRPRRAAPEPLATAATVAEPADDKTRRDLGGVMERVSVPAMECMGPSRESMAETQMSANALPPARGILPSDYTPALTLRSTTTGGSRKRWWLARSPRRSWWWSARWSSGSPQAGRRPTWFTGTRARAPARTRPARRRTNPSPGTDTPLRPARRAEAAPMILPATASI